MLTNDIDSFEHLTLIYLFIIQGAWFRVLLSKYYVEVYFVFSDYHVIKSMCYLKIYIKV